MMWRKVRTLQHVIDSTRKIVTARMASKEVTSSYPTIQPHWVSKATDICAVNDRVYIIRSDLNCYMVTNDLNRGKDIAVHALHPACQGGDHYLANLSGFYIIKGDSVRFVQNLTTDQDSKVFTLHPSNLGATHYASCSIYDVVSWFIIIWADQGKGRVVQYLNTDKEGRNFSLANDCKGGLYYWGNYYFGVSLLKPVGQWGVTYHSTANLETNKDPQDLSISPDVIPFLPGGLTVAQGPSYGRWELIKSFQNSSHTTFKWEQTIKSTVGYNKSELKSIESHWDVKTSAHCEPGDLTAAIAKMEVSMEASYGGSITKISEEAWMNSTEEEETISVDIPPGETVYIWQHQVGFGDKAVLFARNIMATFSSDPPTDDPFKTDKKGTMPSDCLSVPN